MEKNTNEIVEKKEHNALASFGNSQKTMITLANDYCEVFNVYDETEKTELKKLALNYANKLMTTKSKTGQNAFECCTKESIQHTLFECLDKKIDLAKNQGALIVYGNQLQLQTEYFGNIAQAKKLVPYLYDIRGMLIYKDDKIEISIENGAYKIKNHFTNFANMNDKNIVGAYATAIYSYDGGKTEISGETEIMTIQEIKTSWLQGRNGTSVHDKFGHEMTRKTVESRCAKHLINKASGILEVGNDSDDLTTLEELGNNQVDKKEIIINIPNENKSVDIDIPNQNVVYGSVLESQDYGFVEDNTENFTFQNVENEEFVNPFAERENIEKVVFNNNDSFESGENNQNEWFSVLYSDYLNNYKNTGLYENGKYDSASKTIMIRKKVING